MSKNKSLKEYFDSPATCGPMTGKTVKILTGSQIGTIGTVIGKRLLEVWYVLTGEGRVIYYEPDELEIVEEDA